jgi:hypothetical protein
MGHELEGVWKEAVVAWFRDVDRDLPGGTEKDEETHQVIEPVSSWDSRLVVTEHNSEAMSF